jgi:hypothetical protein
MASQPFAHALFQFGAEVGEGAYGSGKFPHAHIFSGEAKALDIALGLGIPVGQLEAEGDGLGVDAVRAPDHWCVLELPSAALEHVRQLFQIGGDYDGRLLDEQGLRSVDYIVRGQAVVKPTGMGADDLGDGGGERDDVVANFGFDFRDAVNVEIGAVANSTGGVSGNHAGFGQGLGGSDLDGKPCTEAIFIAPDSGHVGAGIAWDQSGLPDVYLSAGLGIVNGSGIGGQRRG